jgi:hypothetical protein
MSESALPSGVSCVCGKGTMSSATNQFSAADAALGYLYQARLGMLWALRRLRENSDFVVSLETIDDVTFEVKGRPDELLQTKHHLNRPTNLTDSSPDLWKSLRVWFEGASKKTIPSQTLLYLVTTASAGDGSAAAKLRQNDRDVSAALAALEATAQTSVSQENATAYAAFLAASAHGRRAILERVYILDKTATIVDLDNELKSELLWTTERRHQAAFLQYFEGWWFRRVIAQLVSVNSGDKILGGELEAQMGDLREQFKHDALPIADDLLNFSQDDAAIAAHQDSKFVRQLELANAGKRRIAAAVRDYYRAFEQRSRWLRHDLLMVGDLATYENRLVQEWELVFEAVRDELGEGAADLAKIDAARKVLEWAERTPIPIRPAVTEPFVTRGSLHILADDLRVGWHVEFNARLSSLLTGPSP